MEPAELAQRVIRRERVAIGRALSLVEDRRPAVAARILELLDLLRTPSSRALRVGVTGPPGAGKSSLVALLAREYRQRGLTVGVLAVDPSSPRSGGALLGDRARIAASHDDDGVFVRSMASGGDLGGLARAARSAVDVLAAAYDLVMIETVGVGQNETDVELVADLTAVVMQPASGDVLQFFKAGILEIPDVLVVNKIDLGDVAQRTLRELRASMRAIATLGPQGHSLSVLATSTVTPAGIDEVVDTLEALAQGLRAGGELETRRARGELAWAERMVQRRVGEVGIEAIGGQAAARDSLRVQLQQGVHALEASARVSEDAVRAVMAAGLATR